MNLRTRRVLHWIGRIILADIFIYAGAAKMARGEEFSDSIAGFQILPFQLVNIIALTLPILEIVLGVLVLTKTPRLLRASSFGLIALNGSFIGLLFFAWSRGMAVDCGCFGFQIFPPSAWTIPLAILRDVIFLGVAIMVWREAEVQLIFGPFWVN